MIKKRSEMTELDKEKYIRNIKRELERNYGTPWEFYEKKVQEFIDNAFDDEKFCRMSPDDQIDAAYARKEFGKNKPSIIDLLIFSTHRRRHDSWMGNSGHVT